MQYQSTTNPALRASSAQAVLQGLAADGGLYVTDRLEGFDLSAALKEEDTLAIARRVLSFLLPDFPDMDALVRRAYTGKFETPELTPLQESDRSALLEGLDGVISPTLQDKIWEMIWKRWCAYEDFCHSR